jgi:hypothetical protein
MVNLFYLKFHMNQTDYRYLYLIGILRTHLALNRGRAHNRGPIQVALPTRQRREVVTCHRETSDHIDKCVRARARCVAADCSIPHYVFCSISVREETSQAKTEQHKKQ